MIKSVSGNTTLSAWYYPYYSSHWNIPPFFDIKVQSLFKSLYGLQPQEILLRIPIQPSTAQSVDISQADT